MNHRKSKDPLNKSIEIPSTARETEITSNKLEVSSLEETTRSDYSDIQKDLTYKKINYGNFFILLTYGEFPILVLSKNYKGPACYVIFVFFLRFIGNTFLQENQFFSSDTAFMFKMIANIDVILFLLFVFLNPGIAGFDLGSSHKIDQPEEGNLRYCKHCDIRVARFTKHCNECMVCVKDRSHHCSVTNKCVGVYTKPIIFMIFFSTGLIVLGAYTIIFALIKQVLK